ncbi:glycosyltransferase family 2 protein [Candidatus Gracilibacteria bacterium]|nr:glycosyltransferase family 2 protein [Candidatus Gracilibacteria bacterium]
MQADFVSVVICTRNRGDEIVLALKTLLVNEYPAFEVIVVDQSSDDRTAQAVAPFRNDARLRYLSTSSRGSNTGRQLACDIARGEFILITDDDCEVPRDWIATMAGQLQADVALACVFCEVVAAPFDASKGFVPVTGALVETTICDLYAWCTSGAGRVMAAGLGLRRSLLQEIGGFDVVMGASERFRSTADADLPLRALVHGYRVQLTQRTRVVHHGFRSYEQGRKLMRGYLMGLGAVYAKLIRCGHWQLLLVAGFELWRTVIGPLISNLIRLRRPPVLGRALGFSRGFALGLQTPIDHAREVFLPNGIPYAVSTLPLRPAFTALRLCRQRCADRRCRARASAL